MTELVINNVSKSYTGHGRTIPALQDINLSIDRGEILSVLGLNGAGKTTLVKIIAGLIAPDAGDVVLGGIKYTDRSAFLSNVGVVFEGNRNIYWRLTAFENLEYFGVLRGLSLKRARQRADEMLHLFKLTDKRATVAAHMSRGMQQRLAVGISLIHEPSLVILDEPTLGVDIENVLQIVDTLKLLASQGVTVVLTSHQMDVVKLLSDRIALLVGGRLASVEPKTQFLRHAAMDAYVLRLPDPLDEPKARLLSSLGVQGDHNHLRFDADVLFNVLDIIRPARIESLNSTEDDFSRLLLNKVKEYEYA